MNRITWSHLAWSWLLPWLTNLLDKRLSVLGLNICPGIIWEKTGSEAWLWWFFLLYLSFISSTMPKVLSVSISDFLSFGPSQKRIEFVLTFEERSVDVSLNGVKVLLAPSIFWEVRCSLRLYTLWGCVVCSSMFKEAIECWSSAPLLSTLCKNDLRITEASSLSSLYSKSLSTVFTDEDVWVP